MMPAFASASCMTPDCVAQISVGSCSTQPGCGKICRNSCCAIATHAPALVEEERARAGRALVEGEDERHVRPNHAAARRPPACATIAPLGRPPGRSPRRPQSRTGRRRLARRGAAPRPRGSGLGEDARPDAPARVARRARRAAGGDRRRHVHEQGRRRDERARRRAPRHRAARAPSSGRSTPGACASCGASRTRRACREGFVVFDSDDQLAVVQARDEGSRPAREVRDAAPDPVARSRRRRTRGSRRTTSRAASATSSARASRTSRARTRSSLTGRAGARLRRPPRPLDARSSATHDEVRDLLRRSIRHLLVDEYQDTNRIQAKLVQLVAGEAGNLFVVGDEDQSIYRWRGADVSNILEFTRDFPTARTVRLERNYRSTAPILKAAGAVVAENRRRLGKTLKATKTGRREGAARASSTRSATRRGRSSRAIAAARRARPQARGRGPLPDERAVAAVRGRAPALEHALHPRRRHEVLREGRDQGRSSRTCASRGTRPTTCPSAAS